MDDESYPFSSPYLNYYYVKKGMDASIKKKFKRKAKYEPKLMCWISPRGQSEPYFHLSRGAVDSKIYSENCIEKFLVPFIKKYYPYNDFMF
jgi:hypothetical protein